jgi:hypothetical protein
MTKTWRIKTWRMLIIASAMCVAATQSEAFSLNAPAASAALRGSQGVTIPVRQGGGHFGGFHGGGHFGGGGFHGAPRFGGVHHGFAPRGFGGYPHHGLGYRGFHGPRFYAAPRFYGHRFHHRRLYGPRYYYGGGYGYSHHRRCHWVLTHYGPRRVCRPWGWHHRHHRRPYWL